MNLYLDLDAHAVIKKVLQSTLAFPQKPVNNIPVQERADQLQQVAEIIRKNLANAVLRTDQQSNSAKTDYVIPAFVGGAGIGKVLFSHLFAAAVDLSTQRLGLPWKLHTL